MIRRLTETLRIVDAVDSWARMEDIERLHIRDAVDSWISSDEIERVHVRETLRIEAINVRHRESDSR